MAKPDPKPDPKPPVPLVLNYAASAIAFHVLTNEDVGGKGLRTDLIEERFGPFCRDIRYSATTPGLVILHPLSSGPVSGRLTFLRSLQMMFGHLKPRQAKLDYLRAVLLSARHHRKTAWTDADLEADLQYLLSA